jgi:hypothetical protein
MKSFFLYLILVGLPVLGVSAVIRAGQEIEPPASFGGGWEIEVWPDSTCHKAQFPDTLSLTIEQSGPALTLRFSKGVEIVGRVSGQGFTAAGKHRVRLRAELMADSVARRIRGTIVGAPCPEATQTAILGTRRISVSQSHGH